MHNKFSSFLCFASFLCSSSCSADQFQLQRREQDLRQMKPRNFRRHPLNRHLGRARIAEGASKQKSHPHVVSYVEMISMWFFVFHLPQASYAYKKYWLCDKCDRDFMLKNQLPSMTSKRSHHLIKLLMLIGISIQQRISLQRCHRLTM